MLRRTILVFCLCLAPRPLLPYDGPGTTSADFLKIAPSTRAAAMGEAFVAMIDDTNCIFYNPAGLAYTQGIGLSAMHNEWMETMDHDSFAYRQRLGRTGTIGASYVQLYSGKMMVTYETPDGKFAGMGEKISARDFAFSTAYAQCLGWWTDNPVFRRCRMGIRTKLIQQRVLDVSDSAYACDLGAVFEVIRRKLFFGAVVQNMGGMIDSRKLPTIFRAGYSFHRAPFFSSHDRLIVSMEANTYAEAGAHLRFGVEYSPPFHSKRTALRFGYIIGNDLGALSGLTSGAGFGFPVAGSDLRLDYACTPCGYFGFAHRASLSFDLPHPPTPPRATVLAPDSFVPSESSLFIRPIVNGDSEMTRWRLTIKRARGKAVRIFGGKLWPPRRLRWDGRSSRGVTLPVGSYHLLLEVFDDAGCSVVSSPTLVAIRSPLIALPPLRLDPVVPLKHRYERVFQFSSDLFFEQGDDSLLPDVFAVLNEAIAIVKRDHPNRYLVIVGHSDNVPWVPGGKFRNNLDLSLAQAQAMQRYIIDKGIHPAYMFAVGYGPSMSIGNNSSLIGRALNRRIELLIYRTGRDGAEDMLKERDYFLKRDDYQSALVRLIMAARLDPKDATIFKSMGRCYLRLENRDMAEQCFKRGLELAPEDAELRKLLLR